MVHDQILLEYISKFGIGTKIWDEFLESAECPFYKGEDGKIEFK